MPDQALVMLEVQDDLRYLFQAPSLLDVRGAGTLLESLGHFTLPSLARRREFGGAGILTGAARYVATFPSPEAGQRFAHEARRIYQQRTYALQLRGALEAVSAEDLVGQFGRRLRAVRRRLERADEDGATWLPAYSPELRWCDACRRFPAVRRLSGEWVCRACVSRRTNLADQEARLTIPGYQHSLADAGDEDLAGRPVWERLLRWLRDSGIRRSGDAAADIAELTRHRLPDRVALADGSGRYAVLIAEINDFDRLLERMDDSQRALRTGSHVSHLLDAALFEALTGLAWRDRGRSFNFEVLLSSGERFICLLPADVATAVAARALRTIETQSAAATEGRRLSLCAGIGIAPQPVDLGAAGFRAREALAAARAAYLHPSPAAVRGSWRSVIGVGPVASASTTSVNLGELERALTHARSLRRNGIEAVQLGVLLPALESGATGELARHTGRWTEPQRRALAAISRDLAVGSVDGGPGEAPLWGAIAALLPYVSLEAPVIAPRPRPDLSSAVPPRGEERSA